MDCGNAIVKGRLSAGPSDFVGKISLQRAVGQSADVKLLVAEKHHEITSVELLARR